MPKTPKHASAALPNPNADPFAEREAARYENPIPSREFILEHLEKRGQPATHRELCQELLLFTAEAQEALQRRLGAMTRDGQLISNRRGVFGLVNKMNLIKGRISGHKDGFGFMLPEDGSPDLFLSPKQMRQVFDGDVVLAKVSGVDHRGRREGRIVEVLERKSTDVVGRFYHEQGFGVVLPHNKRITQEILIPPKKHKGAQDGDFVVVHITQFPHEHHKATGEVTEVLGDVSTPGMEVELALRMHDIPHEWPDAVLEEVQGFPASVNGDAHLERIDLRHLPFVTIDGEDAKDFDDAVCCERRRGKGFTLYVAIADVSHYVGVGSALDAQAQLRGNSVYFPGHVIPMLPEQLSNGLCSLKPNEDRLVMVCELDIGKSGEIEQYCFYEGIMHSRARLTYTEVAALLQAPKSESDTLLQRRLSEKHAALLPHLKDLYALFKQLLQARTARGALDFETVETRIVFSEQRRIKEIIPVERNDAHRLIEECMLCANVAAADLLQSAKLPTLYRVHEGPSEEKLENLYHFLHGIGIGLAPKKKPTPQDYQQILARLKGRPDHALLQTLVIRSLMQAVYQPNNLGHFGLGFDAYTHFTSPIRRYPDLLVHRGIRCLIRGQKSICGIYRSGKERPLKRSAIYPYKLAELEQLGLQLSQTERRADAATWDVVNWLKCEYMQSHIGEEFAGVVVGVTNFGLFVELTDVYVEGLVHVTALSNDYYHFDAISHTLTGERSGLCYRLGDQVRVVVAHVNLDERKIELQLLSSQNRGAGRALPQRERHSDKPRDKSSGKPRDKKRHRH
ncbi:MAG: ribonuclease R [Pseudomonadales bacterium]|jgi:ribonuclease R|nr:ribonuclease R [Pseudomonadales bacterium]